MATVLTRQDHLTYKGNAKSSRYGWLRLTPAYSVHLVRDLLARQTGQDQVVLDPFCGTGTTMLVCAELGIRCDTVDINPFLVWLTQAKVRNYSDDDLAGSQTAARSVADAAAKASSQPVWCPPLHQITKWWDTRTLAALARARTRIEELRPGLNPGAVDLLLLAFCRVMIDQANVSFGHQSMSFKQTSMPAMRRLFEESPEEMVAFALRQAIESLVLAARSPLTDATRRVFLGDSRNLPAFLESSFYTAVVTSPPYPNRMSYIRELRPYMYWLGYLSSGRAAGELDWQAIGGTWGCATSNVAKWCPRESISIPFEGFEGLVRRIRAQSDLLGRYVHKYWYDMALHCRALHQVVAPGGVINYIVGNSKFYDIVVPTEQILAPLLEATGFIEPEILPLRKRTSKRELFEYLVRAYKAPKRTQG